MTWRVNVQHWAGWVEGWGRGESRVTRTRSQPPITRENFRDKADAVIRMLELKQRYPNRNTTLVWITEEKDEGIGLPTTLT
jgi:hypothetical protein